MSEIWSRICFINHICFTLCCTSFTECYHCQGHGLSLQADLILSRTSHLPDVFVASFQTCAEALCQMNSLANLSKNTSPQWDPSNKENVSQRRGGRIIKYFWKSPYTLYFTFAYRFTIHSSALMERSILAVRKSLPHILILHSKWTFFGLTHPYLLVPVPLRTNFRKCCSLYMLESLCCVPMT